MLEYAQKFYDSSDKVLLAEAKLLAVIISNTKQAEATRQLASLHYRGIYGLLRQRGLALRLVPASKEARNA